MLSRRVIVCLDVLDGRVVKGVQFVDLVDSGDPVELAVRYQEQGADEIVFLDISATMEERRTMLNVVRRAAQDLSIPLSVGGGLRSLDDMSRALDAGADKVCVNSAAVARPTLIRDASSKFGSQCVIASIDAKLVSIGSYGVFTHGGARSHELDAISWIVRCVQEGAGEILLTSIDRDGTRGGFDEKLTRLAVDAVSTPVIASGGAGGASHFVEIFQKSLCHAALGAGIFHDGSCTVRDVKEAASLAGLPMRMQSHWGSNPELGACRDGA